MPLHREFWSSIAKWRGFAQRIFQTFPYCHLNKPGLLLSRIMTKYPSMYQQFDLVPSQCVDLNDSINKCEQIFLPEKKTLRYLKWELLFLRPADFRVCSSQGVTNQLGVVIPHGAGTGGSCLFRVTRCRFLDRSLCLYSQSGFQESRCDTRRYSTRSGPGWPVTPNCTTSGNSSLRFPGAVRLQPVLTALFTNPTGSCKCVLFSWLV